MPWPSHLRSHNQAVGIQRLTRSSSVTMPLTLDLIMHARKTGGQLTLSLAGILPPRVVCCRRTLSDWQEQGLSAVCRGVLS
jgi:hypothetical protein